MDTGTPAFSDPFNGWGTSDWAAMDQVNAQGGAGG